MNALPVTSIVLCTVLCVAVIGIIFFTWRDRQRAGKAYQQVTYQETVGKEGGNCRCPLCPCSVVEQTDVTIENEGVVQQVGVYAKFD